MRIENVKLNSPVEGEENLESRLFFVAVSECEAQDQDHELISTVKNKIAVDSRSPEDVVCDLKLLSEFQQVTSVQVYFANDCCIL